MQARSAAGRAIVAEVETGVAPPKSYERTIKIRKATIETRIGVRFGLHPETKQVIITELYSGYPAHDCGNLLGMSALLRRLPLEVGGVINAICISGLI